MRKIIPALILIFACFCANGQSGREFWFAPPEVTEDHGGPNGDEPILLRITAGNLASTITIDMPALGAAAFGGAGTLTATIPANTQQTFDLSAWKADLETPSDVVSSSGLHIVATESVTAYYELNTTFNPEIFALKGPNGLGTDFYTPFNNRWAPGPVTPTVPYTSFDIVATEDNTTVIIYPRQPLDGGHPALTSYTITLMRGETYSGSVTSTVGADNPAGTAIVSDKPIAVSVKDDSVRPTPWGGCYDLMGDQIVPVDIVGNEYIVAKGFLNNNIERVFITATRNGTEVTITDAGTTTVTLFAGETYDYQIDDPFTHISSSLPIYALHISGYGCEMGSALLPPLNCAGSDQVSFVRSQAGPTYRFGLSVLVPAGAEGDFAIDGNTTLLQAADFTVVPGTGGAWMAAAVEYTEAEIASLTAHLVTNGTEAFGLGIMNGGTTSGCRYGYFSEFSAKIDLTAGPDATVCANDTAQLSGSVSGGTTTGQWTTSGSGQFLPNDTDLNPLYVPSPADISAGVVSITLTSTGSCTPVSDVMNLNITPAPTVDAGADVSVCENNPDVNLVGTVTIASGGIWSGGSGTFSPNNTSLITTYTPSAAEIASGSVILTLTTTGNGTCNPETDNITITFTPSPTVDAGANQAVCGNNPDATLSGAVTVATGGIWSGGAGTFSPNVNALNATYTPTAGEIATGSVTLTLTTIGNGNCSPESDVVTITYTTSPTANAGVDQTVCENNASVTLNGSVTLATGGVWSGGLGTFVPNANTLNAVYSPTAAEISAGSVTLTLTTTGNGTCNAETDNMTINFTAAPTVNAGADQTVCANNPGVTLNGAVMIATGGVWSGGTGTFVPNANTLNATYTPSAAEITAGTVTLTLTTTGNGTCNPETDDMVITIDPAPVVNAGADVSVCANSPDVSLTGSVSNAGGGSWSGGAGTFNPSNTALNATYTPTAAEIATGTVTLTLTSTGNGLCNAESDNMVVTITPAPTVSAGADQTVCANNADVTLNGTVTVAGGGQWTGGLGTFSPDANTLNAVYSPTAAEISAGSVTLTLTTTGNGTCTPETDNVTISFTAGPTVDAGVDQTVCANNPTVTLNGSVTVATGGMWSGGTGTFSPNANTLNASYTPSAAEITAGTVTLTLTTTGNGGCNAETDDMVITIGPAPIVNAGADVSVCANNPDVSLTGSVSNAGGGTWSGGAGTFNPSNTALNATYTPTAAEITAGTVTLTLTSTGNGLCTAESDNMVITITPPPIVSAGADQTLCANNADVLLNGSVTVAGGGQWTGGLGVFTPDNNTLNATYTPSAVEIASGSLTLTLTSTGNGNCSAESDDMTVTFTGSPTVDAGADQAVCANNPDVNLAGTVTVATGGVWIGGSGTFTPSATDLNATYTPSAAEISAGSVTLTLQTTGNGNCNPETDDMIITIDPEPITNAGPNLISCANNPNVNLGGTVVNATGGIWSGGAGSFNVSTTDLNAIYTPSAGEIAAGTVTLTLTSTGNGTCSASTDMVDITITNAPTADAGADQTVCANNADVTLTGSVTGASGGQWTGGLGTFTPSNNALNVVYTPTASETASGTLTLTLTTTGNGTCNPVTDNITITFTQAPTADAGADVNVCANNADAALAGVVSIASGGIWSGGGGAFNPSNTDLNAVYTPTAGEIAAGSVTLTLTTTGNGNCLPESDDVDVIISPVPNVDAGADQIICVNNLNVNLSGSVSGITNTGQWTTSGSGVFTPNNTTLNATYLPSTGDSAAGTVTITLESTNNGTCLPITDDMVVTILPAGVADAGADATVCANNASVNLNGVVSGGATSGVWSTTGTGVFVPSDSVLNATYVPSAFDAANGGATITLTANSCDLDTDDMVITITPEPVVDAGPDQTVCASNLSISLNGTVSGASTTGVWTTSGTGTFSPNNTDLNATYMASSADSAAQGVTIVLEATGIGSCVPVTDTMQINIFPTGSVNAGPDQSLCANNANVALNGVISGGASQGLWTSTGSGVFVPSDTTLYATYIPSSSDTSGGVVSLTLTATNSCNTASDFVVVDFSPAPFVDAGPSMSMCGTNPFLSVSGVVSGATGGQWTTSGTGTFTPGPTSLNTTYNATAGDIAMGTIMLYLTSTGNGSCNAVTDSMEITITSGIIVNAGSDQNVCSTAGFTALNGSVSNGSTTGVWSTLGSGTFMPNDSVLTAEYHFSNADTLAGTVDLVLTSINNGSCAAQSDTMTISFGSSAYVNAGSDQIVCASNTLVSLNGLVSGGASEGQWQTLGSGSFSPADTLLSTTYSPSATDSINGTVQLVLVSTNHGSCSQGRDTLEVMIEQLPVAQAGSNIQICASVDTIPLTGAVTNAGGGVWTTGGTGSFAPGDSLLATNYLPSTSDLAAGSITLYLTTTGTTICTPYTDSLTIDLVTPLVADFGFVETCVGQPMSFSDSTAVFTGTILSWSWDFNDGDSSSSQNPVHIYSASGTYDVALTVESSLGCSYQIIQTITVNDGPIAAFGMSPNPGLVNESISFSDLSSGSVQWGWMFGDGFGTSTDQTPVYTYSDTGSYTVTQIVTNSFGCADTATQVLTIEEEDDGYYPPSVPTGFSPNGDGDNDVLFVLGGPFLEVELKVYNNWGNLIFESVDEDVGWDGTWDGKDQPNGDYIYTVKARTIDGKEFKDHGSVSIIR